VWVKLHDQAPNDPDIDRLSDGAFRLWISGICYCQAELTDGFIDSGRVRRLTPNYKATHLRELTDSGVFSATADGYVVRNFAKWNKTSDYWRAKRESDAARLADWRARKGSESGM
jgi:hypothetical protein